MTLREIAERTGLTIGFLSQVERNQSAPSLSSLVAIAQAMGVGVERFISSPKDPGGVTRASDRQPYRVGDGAVAYERLSAHVDDNRINAVRMRVPPGYVSEALGHYGEELMYVLDGAVHVFVDGVETELRAGDSIHFSSQRPHRIHNRSAAPCLMLWTGTLPLFDDIDGIDGAPAHDAHSNADNAIAAPNGKQGRKNHEVSET